jgi:hypothetical protein
LDKVIDSLRDAIGNTQTKRGATFDAAGEEQSAADEAARIIKSV